MTEIIALVVSLLLIFFPDSAFLKGQVQQLAYPGDEVICSEVAKAIISNDIETIANMYCEADKNNSERNLTEQIQNLLNAIEGTIIKAEKSRGLGSQSDRSDYGVYESHRDFVLDIFTTETTYRLYIFWVTVDTEFPENVGMGSMLLIDTKTKNKVAEVY